MLGWQLRNSHLMTCVSGGTAAFDVWFAWRVSFGILGTFQRTLAQLWSEYASGSSKSPKSDPGGRDSFIQRIKALQLFYAAGSQAARGAVINHLFVICFLDAED